jgi:hypothetical protein
VKNTDIVNEHLHKHSIIIQLTSEQIAEIKRRVSDREPFATDNEASGHLRG